MSKKEKDINKLISYSREAYADPDKLVEIGEFLTKMAADVLDGVYDDNPKEKEFVRVGITLLLSYMDFVKTKYKELYK